MSYLSTCRLFSRAVVNASCNTFPECKETINIRLKATSHEERRPKHEPGKICAWLIIMPSHFLKTADDSFDRNIINRSRASSSTRLRDFGPVTNFVHLLLHLFLLLLLLIEPSVFLSVFVSVLLWCWRMRVYTLTYVVNKIDSANRDVCSSRWSMMMIQLLTSSTSFRRVLN
jgi:hypothetical protein